MKTEFMEEVIFKAVSGQVQLKLGDTRGYIYIEREAPIKIYFKYLKFMGQDNGNDFGKVRTDSKFLCEQIVEY